MSLFRDGFLLKDLMARRATPKRSSRNDHKLTDCKVSASAKGGLDTAKYNRKLLDKQRAQGVLIQQ